MFKAKQLLPSGVRRFEGVGDTYSIVSMGEKLWVTREPENVKAILATNFKDFGIGQRFRALGALLGQGIFTSDGELWEHSRVRAFVIRGMRGCSLAIGPCPSELYQKPGSGSRYIRDAHPALGCKDPTGRLNRRSSSPVFPAYA
jgi:hypothetical protein